MIDHKLDYDLLVCVGDDTSQVVMTEGDSKTLIVGIQIANMSGSNKNASLLFGDHVVFRAEVVANDTRVETVTLPVPKGSEVKFEAPPNVYLTLTVLERTP